MRAFKQSEKGMNSDMKKMLLIMCVILLIVMQLCVPYISYAQEIVEQTNMKNDNADTLKKENSNMTNENNLNNLESDNTVVEESSNNVENDNTVNENSSNKIENDNATNENNLNSTESDNTVEENLNNIENNNTTNEENSKENIAEEDELKKEAVLLEESERLEEGTYKILMATNPKQSLTVDGGKKEDGANVHLWEYLETPQQQFKIKYDKDGYCEIIPVHSEKRLDVVGWENEANVDQWSENGGNDNQKWIVKKSERGNYNIVSKRQNLYLDAYQSKIENGTNIQVYEKSGGNGQEFKLEKIKEEEKPEKTVEEGTYKIVMATAPKQSLTVDGGKREDGANIHLWEYLETPQQQYNLVYDGEGYYEIIPVNSGKRLDVVGWGNESNVDQWENNGGNDNQKWQIKKSKRGNYNIVSKRENLYLDAYQSKTTNGTNIEVYEKSGGDGQEFKLEKISNRSEKTIEDGSYKIAPRTNKNIVIEASASNTDNNGRIQIWQDYNVDAQRLNVIYENGYYKISMKHSGKYLTVKDNKIQKETEIVQHEWKNEESQKWIIRDNGNESMSIVSIANNNLAMEIKGNIANGSIIVLNETKKIDNQKFSFTKYFSKYIEEGTYGWTGLKVKGNGNGGEYLPFYKIGNGSKKLFANFSIHGFEDSYNRDGQELTYIANEFYNYLKENISEDLVNEWTIYILPVSNPDGQHSGWTNNGPGRNTVYSWAPGNKGIDMNRCFPVNYKPMSGDRNYNGTQPLQAFEAENLRNFILNNKGTKNIVLDVHGWLNETIGDNEIGKYYRNEFGISNHIGTYGSGYLIQWARSVPNTRSMLLELPEVQNHTQVVQRNYADKFINATMKMLKDF